MLVPVQRQARCRYWQEYTVRSRTVRRCRSRRGYSCSRYRRCNCSRRPSRRNTSHRRHTRHRSCSWRNRANRSIRRHLADPSSVILRRIRRWSHRRRTLPRLWSCKRRRHKCLCDCPRSGSQSRSYTRLQGLRPAAVGRHLRLVAEWMHRVNPAESSRQQFPGSRSRPRGPGH